MIRRILTLVLAGGFLVACDYEPQVEKTPTQPQSPIVTTPDPAQPDPVDPDPVVPDPVDPDPVEPDPVEPDPIDPSPVDVGTIVDTPLTPPAPEPEAPARLKKRMDIDQLDAALRRATGGIGWTTTAANGTVTNNFETLSLTLGKPDYLQNTQEDLEPTALFQKFLNEAARVACDELATKEQTGQVEPVLMVGVEDGDTLANNPAAVEANLQRLLRRFHGRVYAPDAPGFVRWRWLFESASHVTDDSMIVWRTVCAGLIVHPDFYTY